MWSQALTRSRRSRATAGEHTFTANELFKMLKRYMSETGAQSSIDSAMSLGHSLSKNYAHLAPKAEGRVAKYRLRVAV